MLGTSIWLASIYSFSFRGHHVDFLWDSSLLNSQSTWFQRGWWDVLAVGWISAPTWPVSIPSPPNPATGSEMDTWLKGASLQLTHPTCSPFRDGVRCRGKPCPDLSLSLGQPTFNSWLLMGTDLKGHSVLRSLADSAEVFLSTLWLPSSSAPFYFLPPSMDPSCLWCTEHESLTQGQLSRKPNLSHTTVYLQAASLPSTIHTPQRLPYLLFQTPSYGSPVRAPFFLLLLLLLMAQLFDKPGLFDMIVFLYSFPLCLSLLILQFRSWGDKQGSNWMRQTGDRTNSWSNHTGSLQR